ncbi:MAG: putative Outer Membrane Protein, partial [Proteobacteria bacterium]|nr:putative Outer Membrane Protein [Pseudomonadota bacterium]
MRRSLLWLPWYLGIAAALPAILLGAVLLVANTPPGREWLVSSVKRLSAGMVSLQGLSGRLPDDFSVAHIEVGDQSGTWLTIEHMALAWSPTEILLGAASIQRLAADRVAIARLPATESDSSAGAAALPVSLDIRSLQVGRLELAPEVAGPFSRALTIEGGLRLISSEIGRFDVSVRELGGEGVYLLRGVLDSSYLRVDLSAHEPDHGAIASAAGLTSLGPLALDAAFHGPRSEVRADVNLRAGELRVQTNGTLDLVNAAADLTASASAPAMQPRAGLSWQGITLNARLRGPFIRAAADGTLAVDALRAGESAARRVALDWHSTAGQLQASGKLEGLRVPGPRRALLENAPVELDASVALDGDDRPVTFSLKHPLIAAEGKFRTAQGVAGEAILRLPDLAPLAEVGGMVLAGRAEFKLSADVQDSGTRLDTDGRLSVTGGVGPLPALIGEGASIAASVTLQGDDIALSRLQFRGKAFRLTGAGRMESRDIDGQWDATLADLHALVPAATGQISTQGKIKGPSNAFALTAQVTGDIAVQGLPRGPFSAKLESKGLPDSPSASLTAGGVVAGSPLQLAVRAQQESGGAVRIDIDRADWKSAHAAGNVIIPRGAKMPLGNLELGMARLSDLSGLVGQPLSG